MNRTNLLSVILAGMMLMTACAPKEKPAVTGTATGSEEAAKVIPVKVMTVAKTKIARTVDYTATVEPFEEVNMAPSTPGRVDKIYVEVGDRVQKGQKLFLMDRTQYYASKIQLASLEKDLARMDTLIKVGSIKQQTYDQMKAQYDVTKTNVDFMEDNTLLEAPFSGVITGKYLEDGELYTGAPSMTGKSAVVTLMQVNPLKVTMNISEQYYPLIKKGMKAFITADVYSNEKFTGKVYRIAPTINSLTRSFEVEVELPNRNDLLKPGMFVRASMDLGEIETFVVPDYTVLVQEGTNTRFVFVVKDNIAERVVVTPGKRFDDQLEIISDNLREGDMLVIEGQAKLINGDKIEIVR